MQTQPVPSLSLAEVLAGGFCRGLSSDQLDRIIDIAKIHNYSGGETLIRMNDRSSDVIVILNGAAKISSYHEVELVEAGPGTILGEVSLVDEQPRSAMVRTAGPTTVACIDAVKLREMLEQDCDAAAKVYRNLARALTSKLRLTTMRLDATATSLHH